ncbi:MAG TPA: hypothetical protein C5S37_09540 [Methanophagales archaeon]|nr:hypothetical protein [Methanophagales archaeon]
MKKKILAIGIVAMLVLGVGLAGANVSESNVTPNVSSGETELVIELEVTKLNDSIPEVVWDNITRDVAVAPIGGTITEADPSDSHPFIVPQGTYNHIYIDIKFYKVNGEWSDLRLKLVDSDGSTVLEQDDGPSWPFPENGERHIHYEKHPLETGHLYYAVIEKISLVGDTNYDGTIMLQT